MAADDAAKRSLIDRLRRTLGEAGVTGCVDDADLDPRTARHVSGRSVGRPVCWVRPQTTGDVAAVVRVAREAGFQIAVVGEATTFWDGLRVGGRVALDATSLRAAVRIDTERRLAWAGAGRSVREIDREARARGLCLAAYPDASGSTPVGSILTVGCTAGVGMGRALPIEQITAATVVLGSGHVARAGASHALGGAPFARHGLPDLLGLLTAAEGRAAVVTEVGLALSPAPFMAFGRATARFAQPPPASLFVEILAAARRAIDRRALDSFRIELAAGANDGDHGLDVWFRTSSPWSAADAAEQAALVRDELAPRVGSDATIEPESEAARRGELPDYDARFSVPPGEHRARIEGGAFWGAEIATGWGSDLAGSLERALDLYRRVGAVGPRHRRLGVYPASHSVSVGLQTMGGGAPEQVDRLRETLGAALPAWLEAGAVPYRAGNLWGAALRARLGRLAAAGDPTERSAVALPERDGPAAVEACFAALDPDDTIPGPAGPRAREVERVRRALLEAHPGLTAMEGSAALLFAGGGSRVVLSIEPAGAAGAQVRGRHLSLGYRLHVDDARFATPDTLRARVRAIAETFLAADDAIDRSPEDPSSAGPGGVATDVEAFLARAFEAADRSPGREVRLPATLLADPSRLADAVDRLRRTDLDRGRASPTIANLPPCMDVAVRPVVRPQPVATCAPLVAPCDRCGAALYCPANEVPRDRPSSPLRVLRHHDATAAALAGLRAVAEVFDRPLPPVALDAWMTLVGDRAGVLGAPAAPWELSVKRTATALLPRLRFVEYAPPEVPGLPPREERNPLRRVHLTRLAESLGATEARAWMDVVEADQPSALELSFGVDVGVDGGTPSPQLYAHVEPRDRVAMRSTLERVLAWAGSTGPTAKAVAASVLGTDGCDVVLVAHAPAPSAPRRAKIYFSRALDAADPASGLAAAAPGALRAFAAPRGLAVLACEPGDARWEKWDFPCAVHYQRAQGLAAAFADGLPDRERDRVARLFDGSRFAAWPTWLSVGASSSAIYFVPR